MRKIKINALITQPIILRIYLKKMLVSSNVIKELTYEKGLIKVNSKIAFVNQIIKNGDIIEILVKENDKNNIIPTQGPLNIHYEDEDILVVYKPKGIATIPSFANYTNSLANYVTSYMLQKDETFVFRAINRLDKSAEGYVVIAKNKLIYSLLKNNTTKYYTAFCYGQIKNYFIDSPILTDCDSNGLNLLKRVISNNGKPAITNIINTQYFQKYNITKCKIYIETGRTHQIRLHTSSQGNFIIGDCIYGNQEINKSLGISNLQLYCNEIYFFHPFLHKTIHLINNINFPLNLE